MSSKKYSFVLSFTFILLNAALKASGDLQFVYNGFKGSNLYLQSGPKEVAEILPNGLLRLTTEIPNVKGHAFYPDPIPFKVNGTLLSFSTSFVFAIITTKSKSSPGHGIVFTIAPTNGLPTASAQDYIGLFNHSSNGAITNHVVGVELDTDVSIDFDDINSNHVGIDINNLISVRVDGAGYYDNRNEFQHIKLASGDSYQVWIEYDASKIQMDVTLAPINMDKPRTPLLTFVSQNISNTLYDTMFIGFSSSTGGNLWSSHYIRGWSFALNTITPPPLDLKNLPQLPVDYTTLKTVLPIVVALVICFGVFYLVYLKIKYSEVLEDWESEYGPHRFKYKKLYLATKGFKAKEVLGEGAFGKVYKGTLRKPHSEVSEDFPEQHTKIAVKKLSHDSKHGMQEFVAEIVTMGRLRHRNLVQLLGYCRRKGELLLVYEFVPNGSLDKILHTEASETLNWDQRFNIIKGVAAGLYYLHNGWDQVVVHRDIKSSNVLLDSDNNAKLGDFGLARLHDHGADPNTTLVKGTLGYLAPEHLTTGHALPSVDVFSFGALILEVVCGRRPIDAFAEKEDYMLVHKVFRLWKRGEVMRAVDIKMEGKYDEEKVEMVLNLGLLCSNVVPEERPTMTDVVEYLNGAEVPGLGGLELGSTGLSLAKGWKRGGELGTTGEFPGSSAYSASDTMFTYSTTIGEIGLPQGR